MRRNITVFADNDIAEALRLGCESSKQFEVGCVTKSYTECYEASRKNDAAAIIIQSQPKLTHLVELMYLLDEPGYSPILIYFEKDGGVINYTSTDPSAAYNVGRITMLFENSLEGRYECRYNFYRKALPGNGLSPEASQLERYEALSEILRGCPSREIETYKKLYSLDLRDDGYYLFFWELQSREYKRHRDNKDVYNFIGDATERRFKEIIGRYAGGEVFHMTNNKRCIIINDLTIRSDASKQAKFDELISELSSCSKSRTTTCYLSDRIDSLLDARSARDLYESEKGCAFFLRNVNIIRPQLIKELKSRQRDSIESVLPMVQKISRYIHYDIMNSELGTSLYSLYFDILKPSLNYTLYYFCVASICSELAKESDEVDMDMLTENLNPEVLRFSSIEEQYRVMCERISGIRAKMGTRRKTKNALALQAMEFIAANYNKDITVPQIASALYVSQIYLSQIFKTILGESIISYIVNYRIEQARIRLEETDDMIYDIAEDVGFHDAKHFSKTFKSIVGVSPSQYRASVRKRTPGV